MNRHIKYSCNVSIQVIESEKEKIYQKLIQEYKDKDNELQKMKDNKKTTPKSKQIINNTNTTNNVVINNYTINAYGNEDMDHIKKKDYIQLIDNSTESVVNLFKLIHFNKKKPKNSNIYISNMKDPYAMVYTGTSWDIQMKADIVEGIYESNLLMIEEKYDELIDELTEKMKNKYKRYMKNLAISSLSFRIKNRIKLILYNLRDIALINRKKIECIVTC
jgi:hypothetical protein